MHDIIDIIGRQAELPKPIRITDVGAMNLGNSERWQGLIDRDLATILGFEPQADECARCNAESGDAYRYLPNALGDGRTWTFHKCRYGATSSIYEPNLRLVRQFHGLRELMEVVEKSEIQTRRLDDISEARQTDFLKLDVQGAELVILENATETLKQVSIIQAEVSFLPLYKQQPLFADVDRFLRSQGFVFHTFLAFGKRNLRPLMIKDEPYAGINQMLWSDAVYARPFGEALEGNSPITFLKRAMLFHMLYQSYDFAARALMDYDSVIGANLAKTYLASLSEQSDAA